MYRGSGGLNSPDHFLHFDLCLLLLYVRMYSTVDSTQRREMLLKDPLKGETFQEEFISSIFRGKKGEEGVTRNRLDLGKMHGKKSTEAINYLLGSAPFLSSSLSLSLSRRGLIS